MEEVELSIEKYNDKGEGIAYYERGENTHKVAVSNVVLGDTVLVTLNKRKRRGIYNARLIKVLRESEYRTTPMCTHTGMCGGCRFQEMEYSQQLRLKEQKVLNEFQDIIKTQNIDIYPIIPCDDPWHYRNKMEFSFSENAAMTKYLGLMIAGASRYVFNVDRCYLANFWVSDVLNSVRKWWESTDLSAYNFSNDEGHFRYLTIREGKNTEEKMVVLTVSGNKDFVISEEHLKSFVEAVKNSLPNTDKLSIYLRTQKIEKKKATEFIERLLFGAPHITEKFLIKDKELSFKISPSSFFQPNTRQAEKLYNKALQLATLPSDAIVYDLYCGTGTLGMAFSSYAKKVVGIELNPECVKDANENIKLNNIDNFEIFDGDVGKVLTELLPKGEIEHPDLVIVDPPRAGLDQLAISHLKMLKPKYILYISCNPKTQAENVKELASSGYKLNILQPLDQFPHTVHIENIALLELS